MDFEQLIPGVIGAFVGVVGWLFVGMYIQRRQFVRQARNAARAVYFELDVNRMAVLVARDFGSFTPLDRSSFERLLPELATLLTPAELKTIVSAYMAHAGYQQVTAGEALPQDIRARALEAILEAHDQALKALRIRAFSSKEAKALTDAGGEATEDRAAQSSRAEPKVADRGG